MTEPAIRVDKIGKRYRVGERESYVALRDVMARALTSAFKRTPRAPVDYLWAVRDVTFDVQQGEVVGLIGRNGAGKSTLLKLLARITRPTEGWAEIHGRVGSLLEVGTGFHPELTGRENVYLSGAILGMKKLEINRKFDEIVAFAEVERFLDTPLKHYSSGMQMRLAFAVAAHLEPEILLVDEVLSVGDMQFQKKCLGKMGDVAKTGRTIVFVSHQMNQIRRLCQRVIWIDAGGIRMEGSAHDVLAAYELAMFAGDRARGLQRAAGMKAQFLRWGIAEPASTPAHVLSTLGPVTVNFAVELARPIKNGEHGVALFDAERHLMWARAEQNLTLEPGVHVFSHSFPTLPLRPGAYQWQVSLWEGAEMLDLWDCLPDMTIATEVHQHHMDEWNGILNLPAKFSRQAGEEIAIERASRI
ncbi:MAG: polysaccharide ABC transporter ATP-binding protein [Candidatus Acidiferrales bacterium]